MACCKNLLSSLALRLANHCLGWRKRASGIESEQDKILLSSRLLREPYLLNPNTSMPGQIQLCYSQVMHYALPAGLVKITNTFWFVYFSDFQFFFYVWTLQCFDITALERTELHNTRIWWKHTPKLQAQFHINHSLSRIIAFSSLNWQITMQSYKQAVGLHGKEHCHGTFYPPGFSKSPHSAFRCSFIFMSSL